MKHVNVRCSAFWGNASEKEEHKIRSEIKAFKDILDKFATDDGFNLFCDMDNVELQVGDMFANTYFSPRTWEAVENFCMYVICHLIESYELDKYPYYDELIRKYAAALCIERGNFE